MGGAKVLVMAKQAEHKQRNPMMRAAVAIWRGYTYFYYRIYTWELKLWSERSAKWAAVGLVTIISWFNLFTVVMCISAPLGGVNYILNQPKSIDILVIIIWYWLNYKALISHDKYKEIVARFSEEKESKRKRNTWFCLLYPLLSFIALTLAAVFV